MSKPVVVVIGATGTQGGSVVDFLLRDGSFRVRGVTRNLKSDKATALTKRGVEVVSGDMDDIPSLVAALEGGDYLFGVTNVWEHGPEKETQEGKNLVDAAKQVGIKHFVFSTLDHSYVPHFESKAKVDDYLKESGISRTSLYTSVFYENFLQGTLLKYASGQWVFSIPITPDSQIPFYSAMDIGGWVVPALKDPKKYQGVDLMIASEFLTLRQLAQQFEEVMGEKASVVEFDEAALEKRPFGNEMYYNFKLYMENQEDSGFRDVSTSLKVFPEAKKWKDFILAHKSELLSLKSKAG